MRRAARRLSTVKACSRTMRSRPVSGVGFLAGGSSGPGCRAESARFPAARRRDGAGWCQFRRRLPAFAGSMPYSCWSWRVNSTVSSARASATKRARRLRVFWSKAITLSPVGVCVGLRRAKIYSQQMILALRRPTQTPTIKKTTTLVDLCPPQANANPYVHWLKRLGGAAGCN
jgi:hypothetical protein